MDSVNVPVPGQVEALAADVAADLRAVGGRGDLRVREDRTLVAKRLPAGDPHRIEARAREALAGTPPFEVRIDRVDQFPKAASGPSPVVYLAVESPGLDRLHDRLCTAFDPVEGLEGSDYVPHVTVARGGDPAAASQISGPIEPVKWTVAEVWLWDATRGLAAGRVSLPA